MMNPSSAPCPNLQFHHYPPQIPNPNPNPNPSHQFSIPSVPPPPPPSLPPPTTQSHDLSTTLSSLTNLLTLTHQTLTSLSSLLPTPQNASLVPCPHNPNHLMPPESLFLHTLQCSSLFQNPSAFLHSLHYLKTLDLDNNEDSAFTQSARDTTNSELCLSLDSYFDEFCSNFFYRDCPGVVKFNGVDGSRKTVNLPDFLVFECGNLGCGNEAGKLGFGENEFKVLPSELWAIRREIEGLVDYPSSCSYSVVCANLRLDLVMQSDLRKWVIVNSPRFGVAVDVYMRDHMCVLFVLCLKAIKREAIRFFDGEMNLKILNFNCPVLVQGLMWISSQLSVLYGELNAKYFVLKIFKQCVLEAAKKALLFPLKSNLEDCTKELEEQKSDGKAVTSEEPLGGNTVSKAEKENCIDRMVIDVSQVATAVAALHERSLLERKLRDLRNSQFIPAYHRGAEHTHISMRAVDERKQRPNYRSVIEQDGLLRKQSDNRESNKFKTKQELLAEERDYKRRRMSYRGKKLKRSTIEVMRDLIDEYMDEIKQAGGIGFEKLGEEGMSAKSLPASDATIVADGIKKKSEIYESEEATPIQYHRHNHSDFRKQSGPPKDGSFETEQEKQSTGGSGKHLEYSHRSFRGDNRYGRENYSVTPERRKRHYRSNDRSSRHQREEDEVEFSRSRNYDKNSSDRFNQRDYGSSSFTSTSGNNSHGQEYEKKSDIRVEYQRSPIHKHPIRCGQNAFDDRYVPTESYDMDE